MKKTQWKKAIDKLFDQLQGYDPEQISVITLETVQSEDEFDKSNYVQVEFRIESENYMYNKPKVGTVVFEV